MSQWPGSKNELTTIVLLSGSQRNNDVNNFIWKGVNQARSKSLEEWNKFESGYLGCNGS